MLEPSCHTIVMAGFAAGKKAIFKYALVMERLRLHLAMDSSWVVIVFWWQAAMVSADIIGCFIIF